MGSGKHKYDVDPIGILNTLIHPPAHLNFYSEEKRQQFIRQTRESLIIAMSMTDGSKLDRLLSEGANWVIRIKESDKTFPYWLGLHLSVCVPSFIPLILDYHWRKVDNEKWFLGRLEFEVLVSIVNNNSFNTSIQQSVIIQWLRNQKGNLKITSTILPSEDGNTQIQNVTGNKTDISRNNLKKDNIDNSIRVNSFYLNDIFNTLKLYIPDSRHTDFLNLLNDKTCQNPIKVNCTCIYFTSMFKKIKKKEKIGVSNLKVLGNWIASNFLFYDDKNKIDSFVSHKYVTKILYGQYQLTNKEKIKLELILNF